MNRTERKRGEGSHSSAHSLYFTGNSNQLRANSSKLQEKSIERSNYIYGDKVDFI